MSPGRGKKLNRAQAHNNKEEEKIAVSTMDEIQPIRIAKEQPNFVMTPYVKDVISRSLLYLRAGFPINFSSPTGMGKTTLAVYTAAQLGEPVILIHGEDEFVTSDLVGGEYGYQRKKVVDNFIHSVLKTEEIGRASCRERV